MAKNNIELKTRSKTKKQEAQEKHNENLRILSKAKEQLQNLNEKQIH